MGENKAYKTPTDIYSNNPLPFQVSKMFLKEHRNTFGGISKKIQIFDLFVIFILEYIKIENCFFFNCYNISLQFLL